MRNVKCKMYGVIFRLKSPPGAAKSVVVLMDARHGCWRMLRSAIEQVQITLANQLAALWALKPEPFWEKQHVECMKSRPDCKVSLQNQFNHQSNQLKRLFVSFSISRSSTCRWPNCTRWSTWTSCRKSSADSCRISTSSG